MHLVSGREIPAHSLRVVMIAIWLVGLLAYALPANALNAALTPSFDTPVRTVDGFTVQVTNFDNSFTWSVSSNVGNSDIDASGFVTVSGLSAGVESTVTVTTEQTDYDTGSATVSGAALEAALVPQFDSAIQTADGFTVQITNFDNAFTWSASVTASGYADISALGLVTVAGLSPDEYQTVTVTTNRDGYVEGSDSTMSSSLVAALTPQVGEAVRTSDGFFAEILNYDFAYTWTATSTYGTADIVYDAGQYRLVVSGLNPDTEATVTVTTSRDGYAEGSSDITATSLAAGITPTFDTPVRTADGFYAAIINYDADYTWNVTSTIGSAEVAMVGGVLSVVITGLNPDTEATATVTASRDGYVTGTADVTAASLRAALTPTFGVPVRTADGFTVEITNYDANFTWTGSATAGGSVTIDDNGWITVTGVAQDTESTATIVANCDGYVEGSSDVAATSLAAGITPTFGVPVRSTDGFTVEITNYVADFSWFASSTEGVAEISASGGDYVVVVSGLSAGQETTVTVTASRDGYVTGTAYVTATALLAALVPEFGVPVPTADGFTVQVINFDANYTWLGTATATGTVAISNTGLVTVSEVAPDTESTATITTNRDDYAQGLSTIMGTSLKAAFEPTFSSHVPLEFGFTVQVSNYNAEYAWAVESSNGSSTISDSGLVTVSGLTEGGSAAITVTATRAGHADGSSSETFSAAIAYELSMGWFTTSQLNVAFGFNTQQTANTINLSRSGNSGTNPTTTISVASGTWQVTANSGTQVSSSSLTSSQSVTITLTQAAGTVTISLVSPAAVGTYQATLNMSSPRTYGVSVSATIPSNPNSLKAKSKKKAKATISWITPSTNGGANITHYVVKLKRSGKTITKKTASSSIIISKLKRKKTYTVTVTACNAAGCSVASTGKVKIK